MSVKPCLSRDKEALHLARQSRVAALRARDFFRCSCSRLHSDRIAVSCRPWPVAILGLWFLLGLLLDNAVALLNLLRPFHPQRRHLDHRSPILRTAQLLSDATILFRIHQPRSFDRFPRNLGNSGGGGTFHSPDSFFATVASNTNRPHRPTPATRARTGTKSKILRDRVQGWRGIAGAHAALVASRKRYDQHDHPKQQQRQHRQGSPKQCIVDNEFTKLHCPLQRLAFGQMQTAIVHPVNTGRTDWLELMKIK